jgi:hypothetical protein
MKRHRVGSSGKRLRFNITEHEVHELRKRARPEDQAKITRLCDAALSDGNDRRTRKLRRQCEEAVFDKRFGMGTS